MNLRPLRYERSELPLLHPANLYKNLNYVNELNQNSGGVSRTHHSFRLRYERSQRPTACPRKFIKKELFKITRMFIIDSDIHPVTSVPYISPATIELYFTMNS